MDATEHTCQLVVEGTVVFFWGVVIVGAYTLIMVAKLSLLRGSLIVVILSLTGRDIYVSFVTISVLIAKPTQASLQDSENLVSHRATISIFYLANSIATSAVHLSGRSASSRSRRVLTFHCPIVSSCLLLPSSCSTIDGR